MLAKYQSLANAEKRVKVVGRLGAYRNIDMDVSVSGALGMARAFLCGRAQAVSNRYPLRVMFIERNDNAWR
jgi:hypothetical protein